MPEHSQKSQPSPRHPTRRWLRRLLVTSLLVLVAAGATYVVVERSCDRTDPELFLDLRGALVHATERTVRVTDTHETLRVELADDLGLQVVGHLKRPARTSVPHPAFLLLGGVRTGRNAVDFIPDFSDVVLLALDYPYTGKRSGLSVVEFATALPAMRRAVLRTVPAAMLAVDYLHTRADVDPDRIVLIGGSVGTLFAPAVGASDPRIDALVLLFGGGDIQSLLAHIAAEDLGWFTRPGAWLGKALTCPVEPLHHIGNLSPRPVFMLNGTEDIGIPEHNTRLLFEAANEPKTIRWIEAGHVLLQDPAFHQQVTDLLIDWLIESDLIEPSTAPEGVPHPATRPPLG